ncbi:MAG TPA: hypothetical protein VF945_09265 [Polyangia bacterium]
MALAPHGIAFLDELEDWRIRRRARRLPVTPPVTPIDRAPLWIVDGPARRRGR